MTARSANGARRDVTAATRATTATTRAATATTTAAAKALTVAGVRAVKVATEVATGSSRKLVKELTASTVSATETATRIAADAADAATDAAFHASASLAPVLGTVKKQGQETLDTLIAQTKELSLAWLDTYNGGLAAYVDLRKSLAAATSIGAVVTLDQINAKVLTDLNSTYLEAVRDLLR